MSVWDRVVGQPDVVRALSDAVSVGGRAVAHAWLITGPPGSGRSVAAQAFAAALQCSSGGCGTCNHCRTVLNESSPNVRIVRSGVLSHGKGLAHELVMWSALAVPPGQWRVLIMEDADRLTDEAANALLKAIEEPPEGMVWLLCAPSPEDVLPTIRSRTRSLRLGTPSTQAIAEYLASDSDVEPAMAAYAARAAQGHIGRARALARDAETRSHRSRVLALSTRASSLAGCFSAAADLIDSAKQVAGRIAEERNSREVDALLAEYGFGDDGITRTKAERLAGRALRELKDAQRSRNTRIVRDELDRDLVDLLGYYRDVLVLQSGADADLINPEELPALRELADSSTPEQSLRRMQAIARSRVAVQSNVSPQVALEAMAVQLVGRPVPELVASSA